MTIVELFELVLLLGLLAGLTWLVLGGTIFISTAVRGDPDNPIGTVYHRGFIVTSLLGFLLICVILLRRFFIFPHWLDNALFVAIAVKLALTQIYACWVAIRVQYAAGTFRKYRP